MKKWEEFWYAGGTEEGDAKIFAIREMLVLRFAYREESIESNVGRQRPLPAGENPGNQKQPSGG